MLSALCLASVPGLPPSAQWIMSDFDLPKTSCGGSKVRHECIARKREDLGPRLHLCPFRHYKIVWTFKVISLSWLSGFQLGIYFWMKTSVLHLNLNQDCLKINPSINGKHISSKAVGKVFQLIFPGNPITIQFQFYYRESSPAVCLYQQSTLCTSLVFVCIRSYNILIASICMPHLLVDIKCLELVQKRSTKFITSNPLLNYKYWLITLNLLPLMMEFENVLVCMCLTNS